VICSSISSSYYTTCPIVCIGSGDVSVNHQMLHKVQRFKYIHMHAYMHIYNNKHSDTYHSNAVVLIQLYTYICTLSICINFAAHTSQMSCLIFSCVTNIIIIAMDYPVRQAYQNSLVTSKFSLITLQHPSLDQLTVSWN